MLMNEALKVQNATYSAIQGLALRVLVYITSLRTAIVHWKKIHLLVFCMVMLVNILSTHQPFLPTPDNYLSPPTFEMKSKTFAIILVFLVKWMKTD